MEGQERITGMSSSHEARPQIFHGSCSYLPCIRPISVEVGVHPGANGSSRVTLGRGSTEVWAVVKVSAMSVSGEIYDYYLFTDRTDILPSLQVELGQPLYEDPKRGRLEVNVEVSEMALGKGQQQDTDIDELNAELSKVSSGTPELKDKGRIYL